MLTGNNPRFPWKPSATMLISRHTGTTVDSASDRSGHSRFSPRPTIARHPEDQAAARHRIFAPPRRAQGALSC